MLSSVWATRSTTTSTLLSWKSTSDLSSPLVSGRASLRKSIPARCGCPSSKRIPRWKPFAGTVRWAAICFPLEAIAIARINSVSGWIRPSRSREKRVLRLSPSLPDARSVNSFQSKATCPQDQNDGQFWAVSEIGQRKMNVKVITVNAFTDKPFGGNPAAVCVLGQSVETNWMQHIAREMNQPATAFVLRQNGDNDHF